MKYYIVPVWGCVDPEPLRGPYPTFGKLLKAARRVYKKQDDDDAIFWLRLEGKVKPQMGAFSGEELGAKGSFNPQV